MSRIPALSTIVVLCAVGPVATQAQTPSTAGQYSISHAVVTEYPTPSAQSLPQGLDIDASGNIWYTETTAGKIAVLRTNPHDGGVYRSKWWPAGHAKGGLRRHLVHR